MYNKVPTLIYQPQEKKVDSYISRKMSLIDKISIYKQNSSTFNKKEIVLLCSYVRILVGSSSKYVKFGHVCQKATKKLGHHLCMPPCLPVLPTLFQKIFLSHF